MSMPGKKAPEYFSSPGLNLDSRNSFTMKLKEGKESLIFSKMERYSARILVLLLLILPVEGVHRHPGRRRSGVRSRPQNVAYFPLRATGGDPDAIRARADG